MKGEGTIFLNPLVSQMLSGDKRALSRLMTYVDNRHEDILAIMAEVYTHTGKAYRIGVTGPPGAGKSTLVDKLIRYYRSKNKTVGVVAIDPSSPFTGGAVLGDRIRMIEHGGDEGVFIRSLGSHGAHGGLSRATRDVATLMDAFGFDIVIIETVGVGQTELDIMNVAHTTLVVLVPESGDTIQTMKAGLMEIADIFAVNKADRDGADRIFAELKALVQLFPTDQPVPVLKVEAVHNRGIKELGEVLDEHFLNSKKPDPKLLNLLREECLDIALGELGDKISKAMEGNLKPLMEELADTKNPYLVASKILKKLSY